MNFIPFNVSFPEPKVGSYEEKLVVALQAYNKLVRKTVMSGVKDGTFIYDDGVVGRVTMVFEQGRLSDITVAASSAAVMTWTAT